MALRLSRLVTIAFSGMSSDPVNRNSRTKVDSAITASAHGNRSAIVSVASTRVAAEPPTSTYPGAGWSRISDTTSRASVGSAAEGVTASHVPEGAVKRALRLASSLPVLVVGRPSAYWPVAVSTLLTPGRVESCAA
ncbi:hypothetical protein [Nocardioides sp. TF02-7]|uniref:hypothetical protein n=1 Tax=Nocardioides sp. TF02-7 TaxID=2917724 RepID=UPI0023DCE5FB|nr:hypothetical protein [Nocardioides sp. TF02-7]